MNPSKITNEPLQKHVTVKLSLVVRRAIEFQVGQDINLPGQQTISKLFKDLTLENTQIILGEMKRIIHC